jgi:hypothetical protein
MWGVLGAATRYSSIVPCRPLGRVILNQILARARRVFDDSLRDV